MMCGNRCAPALVGVVAWAFVVSAGGSAEPTRVLRVGFSSGLFPDGSETLVRAALPPLQAVVERQTGFQGECVLGGGYEELAGQLREGKVQLGVFQGHELAWARGQDPRLHPLLIAVNQERFLFVHVLVRCDCRAASLGDLQDAAVAVPRGSRAHCRLFVSQRLGENTAPASGEDALDDLVEGKVRAAVVDGEALESYQRRKPGRFARLKEIHKAGPFPAPVVVFRTGGLTDAERRRIAEGLARTHQTVAGKQVLQLWKLTAFEPIPEGYEAALAEIARSYPPPGNLAVKSASSPGPRAETSGGGTNHAPR